MASCPLIINNPKLLSEWDYAENAKDDLFPEKVTCGSNKRAWWVCSKGHHWQAVIHSRFRGGHGCPYCSGRMPIIGENDLATVSPLLAQEWNYEKNGNKKPEMYLPHSGKKVWWRCAKRHEWQAVIIQRQNGVGCPYCSGREAVSGENDLSSCYPRIAEEWDYNKNGTRTPDRIKPQSNQKVFWICEKGHSFSATVCHRVAGSGCPYCSNKKLLTGFNDLATVKPEIAKEWDYSNNPILPSEVTYKDGKKYSWICKKGHCYTMSVASRSNGHGCPYCINQKVLVGYNDLKSTFPKIAAEWDYEKNGKDTPQTVVYGSQKRVWWKCSKGHEWSTSVQSRTHDGTGCPVCNKARMMSFPEKALCFYIRKQYPDAISNYRSRSIHHREIDVFIKKHKIGVEYDGDNWHQNAERDNEKNRYCVEAGITLIRIREPDCPPLDGESIDYQLQDHSTEEYEKGIVFALRTIAKLTKGAFLIDVSLDRDSAAIIDQFDSDEVERSLAVVNPELAKEWHPSKNLKLLPTQVYAASGSKVWWLGRCGHEWMASVARRNAGTGCPVCRGLEVLKGFNDLETLFPTIAAEWDYEKNVGISPSEVPARTPRKMWWKCSKNHEYQKSVYLRTKLGSGCPYCSNKKVLAGYNDLQTTNPEIAEEWNYEKNDGLLPTQVVVGSGRKVWWKCKACGYEWEAYISNRKRGYGCPICRKRQKGSKQK